MGLLMNDNPIEACVLYSQEANGWLWSIESNHAVWCGDSAYLTKESAIAAANNVANSLREESCVA